MEGKSRWEACIERSLYRVRRCLHRSHYLTADTDDYEVSVWISPEHCSLDCPAGRASSDGSAFYSAFFLSALYHTLYVLVLLHTLLTPTYSTIYHTLPPRLNPHHPSIHTAFPLQVYLAFCNSLNFRSSRVNKATNSAGKPDF